MTGPPPRFRASLRVSGKQWFPVVLFVYLLPPALTCLLRVFQVVVVMVVFYMFPLAQVRVLLQPCSDFDFQMVIYVFTASNLFLFLW